MIDAPEVAFDGVSAAGAFALGLPAWAYAPWRPRFFPNGSAALASYAEVFDCVEGNITFYTLPDAAMIARWRALLQGRGFRFCFKLPRSVTHGGLAAAKSELAGLFTRLEPLGEHCGPFMVQLPPGFGPSQLPELEALLRVLPCSYRYAVEVRHRSFFAAPQALFELLDRYDCGRVLLDSRPIYGDAPAHPDLTSAVHEKPDLPLLLDGPETLRIVRFVGHPLAARNVAFMQQWARHLSSWLRPGRTLYLMVHCPNDGYCPSIARSFHELLRSVAPTLELPALPPWPVPQLGLDL